MSDARSVLWQGFAESVLPSSGAPFQLHIFKEAHEAMTCLPATSAHLVTFGLMVTH